MPQRRLTIALSCAVADAYGVLNSFFTGHHGCSGIMTTDRMRSCQLMAMIVKVSGLTVKAFLAPIIGSGSGSEAGLGLVVRSNRLCAAGFLLLDRWAWHRCVRAIDAAVALLGLQNGPTPLALIEPLAGICGHRFCFYMPAGWAGEC